MERALKYTLVTLLVIVVVVVGFLYGLYFAGARHVSPDWRPTTAQYPDPVRIALWRSYGGQGSPEGNPMSPLEYAWRWSRAGNELMERRPVDPAMHLAGQVGRLAQPIPHVGSMLEHHLTGMAGAMKASRWPVESQLDTLLDNAWFGEGVRGYRQGALRVFGQPLERLDAARLHVLMTLALGPGYYDPWCHPERLRERTLAMAPRWKVPASRRELDAALASIGPPPVENRCAGRN